MKAKSFSDDSKVWPTRISLVCVSLRGGGTERIVSRIANHLAVLYEVNIVTLAPGKPFYPLNPDILVRSPKFRGLTARKPLRILGQVGYLFRTLRSIRPVVTLVFGEDVAGAVCLTSRLAGVRTVLVLLRGTPGRSLRGLNGLVNPWLFRLARRTVVQTKDSERQLSQRYPKRSLLTIPNPVEVPSSVPALGSRERVILSVGSLGRKKNQGALIRAFTGLTDQDGWRLVFVGDGPDRANLEELVATHGIGDRVEFIGERHDVETQLSRARVFAFTSLSEGFPNALAEALAAGCACISYDCPAGPSDLIEDEVNGLLVPNDDEGAFRESLQRLIGDSALQSRLAGAARNHIRQFDSEVVLARFEALVRECLPEAELN